MFNISNDKSSFCAEEIISSGKFGHVWSGHDTKNNNQKVIIKESSQNHAVLIEKLSHINHSALQAGEYHH